NDKHLKLLEEKLNISIGTRGEGISVSGSQEDIARVQDVLFALLSVMRKGLNVVDRDVIYAVDLARQDKINQFIRLCEEDSIKNIKGIDIRVKTLGQKEYLSAIKSIDLVFGIGPAGTGKTYLAVVMAVKALKDGTIKRIILTRPAVEAGESLGFLPG